jgi:hypothetical protein
MSVYPIQELRIIFQTSDDKIFFVRREAQDHQKELDDIAETEEEMRESFKEHKIQKIFRKLGEGL